MYNLSPTQTKSHLCSRIQPHDTRLRDTKIITLPKIRSFFCCHDSPNKFSTLCFADNDNSEDDDNNDDDDSIMGMTVMMIIIIIMITIIIIRRITMIKMTMTMMRMMMTMMKMTMTMTRLMMTMMMRMMMMKSTKDCFLSSRFILEVHITC